MKPVQIRPISRPTTAQPQKTVKDVSAIENHQSIPPLGTFSSDDRGYVSTIKSEILMLQRKLDFLQANRNGHSLLSEPVTPRMIELERQLMTLNYDPVDATQRYKNEVRLLDTLFGILNEFGHEMFVHIADNGNNRHHSIVTGGNTNAAGQQRPFSAPTGGKGTQPRPQVSRIGTFLDLADCLSAITVKAESKGTGMTIGTQTDAWDGIAPTPTKSGTPNQMSDPHDAVLSPAVNSLKQLIEHQRELQSRLETTLTMSQQPNTNPTGSSPPPVAPTPVKPQQQQQQLVVPTEPVAPTPPVASKTKSNVKNVVTQKKTTDSSPSGTGAATENQEANDLRAEVAKLQQQLHEAQEQLTHLQEERKKWETEISVAGLHAQSIGFANVPEDDYQFLDPLTFQVQRLMPKVAVESFLRMCDIIKEAVDDALDSKDKPPVEVNATKGAKDKNPQLQEMRESDASIKGNMYLILRTQNNSILKLIQSVKQFQKQYQDAVHEGNSESKKLKLLIAELQEKLSTFKAQKSSEVQSRDSEISSLKKEVEVAKQSAKNLMEEMLKSVPPVVRHTEDVPTIQGREQAWKRALNLEKRAVKDATTQLQLCQEKLNSSEAQLALLSREKTANMQAVFHHQQLRLKAEEDLANTRAQLTKITAECESLRSELQRKLKVESELNEIARVARLELSIAQNTTLELRKEMERSRQEAANTHKRLDESRNEIEEIRREFSATVIKLQSAATTAQSEANAAKKQWDNAIARERHGRREVERLQLVEYDMASLKRSFDNFAVAKSALREAAVEEEIALKKCLEAITADSFTLPRTNAQRDELAVALERLKSDKEKFDSEYHVMQITVSDNNVKGESFDGEVTYKATLTALLRCRMTDVQIFAIEQALKEYKNKSEIQSLKSQLSEAERTISKKTASLESVSATCESYKKMVEELEPVRTNLMMANTAMKTKFDEMKEIIAQQAAQLKHNETVISSLSASLKVAQMTNAMLAGRIDPVDGIVKEQSDEIINLEV